MHTLFWLTFSNTYVSTDVDVYMHTFLKINFPSGAKNSTMALEAVVLERAPGTF